MIPTVVRLAPLAALTACGASANDAVFTGESWDWQLQGPYDFARTVDVIDLDPDEVSPAIIKSLKDRGITTIAYVSVGTVENYRDDAGDFPARVVGKTYDDWPDEKFLDIRDHDALLPIMRARFQRAKDMGFDAIEPDNMDVYINDSGFPISADATVSYVTELAGIAHGMDLLIGQKNVPDLAPRLVDIMDFMIAESCFADGWCDQTLVYIEHGKPVYDVEYTDTGVDWADACRYARRTGISMILHNRDLAGPALESC